MSASAVTTADSMFAGLSDAEIEILKARAARYARSVEVVVEHVADVVVFTRASMKYAAPLDGLREIRPLRAICRIPGAARCVPGVFHYRGEILSVHDLEAFLGAGSSDGAAWVIIVEHGEQRLGLMADDIVGVEPARTSALRPLPVSLGDAAGCFAGVLDGGTVLLEPAGLFTNPQFFSAF